MAYTRELTEIAGVKVKIATGTYGRGTQGQSQTVNVFDHSNTEGNYRQVYRIWDPLLFVTAAEVRQAAASLSELDSHMAARAAVREGPRRKRA